MPGFVCQKCGFNNPPGMRFCGNCGARLDVDTGILQSRSPLPGELPGMVGVMMGADLLERFRQAGLEATGQRRTVTILFVDLAGFTAYSQQSDSEDVYLLIQQFINQMVKNVYKYDGMVDKFLGDGLMAIFGAPIAHENNAELAIRAALDMQADLTRMALEVKEKLGSELRVHIGLHSGQVVVGSLGTNLLMNYTAIGDTVNLAYRLQQSAAPGMTLASHTVFQQTRALVDFGPAISLALKGMPEPIPSYPVIQLKPKPGPVRGIEGMHTPMIGRDAEMMHLRQAQEGLIARREGGLITIQAEAGIGKSRLITEFAARLEQAGVRCLIGHSYVYRRSVAYWAFIDLFYAYLDLPANSAEAALHARLTQRITNLLGAQANDTLPYLETMLSMKVTSEDAVERLRYLDAPQLRQQIFLAVREVWVAEARRNPLVLVFEDLHWADESSLDLMRFLIDSARQEALLLVAAYRPGSDPAIERITDHARRTLGKRFENYVLNSLNSQQSEQLFDELLASPDLPEELCQKIIQQAAGNPFYLEEIVRMLIDERVISYDDGRWSLSAGADVSSLGVPDSLQELILTRFDHLDSPDQRRLLQVASVIGRDFSSRLLEAVLTVEEVGSLTNTLNRLIERGFVQPLPDAMDADYRFTHTLVSDTIYSTLLKTDRSDLHGRVAHAMETLYSDWLDDQIEILARHYAWSNDHERALHYLILAGQKAARSYANEQARAQFELAASTAKKVHPDLDTLLQIDIGLGDVLTRTGEYQNARKAYTNALEAIDRQYSPGMQRLAEPRSSLQRKIATTYERQGEYSKSLSALAAARSSLDDMPKPPPTEQAWILNDTGWVYFRRGEMQAAESALLDGLRLVEDSPNYDLIASIYNRLGGIYYQTDQLEQAANYVRKSLFLREEIGDVNAAARTYNNLGLLLWKRGDWDSALDNFNRSLKLHSTLGDVEGAMEVRTNLGLLQLDRGNFEEARNNLETALASAQTYGHTYHIGMLYLHFSRLWTAEENWKKSMEACQQGQQIFTELGVNEYLVDLKTYTGLAYLGLGNIDQASACADEAISLFDHQNADRRAAQAEDRARALRLMGLVAEKRRDYNRAKVCLTESQAIFAAVGNEMEEGRSACYLASLAVTCGDEATARGLLNQARMTFRQLGARADMRRVDALTADLNHISALL
jgi:predicted ATPase/class 3 adenylate cyclase